MPSRPKVSLRKLQDFDNDDQEEDTFSSILGVKMNAAPDLDQLDSTGTLSQEEHHHKKYVKEVWPGRKPIPHTE